MSIRDEKAVRIVQDFAWRIHDGRDGGYGGDLSANGARRLLDDVTPQIAAQALRETADAVLDHRACGHLYGATGRTWATWLRARADEIEATS